MKTSVNVLIFTMAFTLPLLFSLELKAADDNSYIQMPNFWESDSEKPKKQKPYRLPRFDDTYTNEDHYTPVAPIKLAKYVDAESLFNLLTGCYPEPSKFNLEVTLETSFKNRSTYDVTGSNVGKHYVGIVARMPLYSTKEFNRERQRELLVRQNTAALISSFMINLAKRNHSQRELGLYSSLEARAQIRVQSGFTGTEEQVKYLEKVAVAQRELIEAEAKLIQYRIQMVAMCQASKAHYVNRYIARLTKP